MTTINLLTGHAFNSQTYEFLQFLQKKKIISLMLMISVILHTLLFLRYGDISQDTSNKSTSRSLAISLTRITPEAPPEVEQKPQPKVRPKPVLTKPELVKKVERPAEKLITEKNDHLTEQKQEQEQQPLRQAVQDQQKAAPVDPALLSRTKDEYMRILAAHIDKHKFYPRSARRRHIEGLVGVSFDLLKNGQILNLHTFSGHPTLQKASMDSIRSALPMPPRPESLLALNTMKIEYSMQFALK
ncbi:MAG: energy transducer TonB [Gammaproteobacteria bacterium]|nr:energy transducer TonB [Gammaproteobacteria bacterium]